MRATVTVRGRAIHGSRPWLGIDAVEKAVQAMNRLYLLRDILKGRRHPLLGYPTTGGGHRSRRYLSQYDSEQVRIYD
ncbi:MAG TPA: peptidase dimerization domain-containing protein [Firmicutes bacterium]|nr:peptidase dimerization domain-containing protein [Bacillota bacterium]